MEFTTEQNSLFEKHLELVIEANKITNLTRIVSPESGRLLHIEDSLAAVPEVLQAPEGKTADIGTGGGFPGIPLSIATGRPFDLIDSVGKKTAQLDSIIEQLGLSDRISTWHGRIEDLGSERKGQYALVTARALAALPVLLELASPLLKMGGQLISYKSGMYQDELERALAIQNKVGMKFVSVREFMLSDNETSRSVLVFEKASKPKMSLPRRVGLAQKKPLA